MDKFHGGKAWIPSYTQHILVTCLLSALLALGLNFISGYLGQTSLGHAAFYGIGAYTTAVLLTYTGLNFWLSIFVGMLMSMLLAIPLAAASLRVKGQFLVVITYAFCEIFRYIAINVPVLGGTGGMATKLTAAELCMDAGIPMLITKGDRAEVLYDIVEGRAAGTLFTNPKATKS